MRRYRATVWHLSSTAAAVDGDSAISRYVTEEIAESADMAEAQIRDRYLRDVDAEVTIGPLTDKGPVVE